MSPSVQSYRLFKLVQVLRPEELGEVQRFLLSPFFNTNERCTRLFQVLCKYYPSMDSPKLTKERLYAKVFDKSPYDDGKMRKTMTYLTQLIERYLRQQMLEKLEDIQAQLLVRSLGERNNYDLFREAAERRLEALEGRPERGKDYFREQHLLNELLYFHPETEKMAGENMQLHRAIEGLEKYFTLLSLQNASEFVLRNRVVKPEVKMRYLEMLMGSGEDKPFSEENVIQFFRTLVWLHKGNEEGDLGQLKDMVLSALKNLSRYEESLGINSLRNYAIPKLNAGSFEHAQLVLELYKYEINNNMLVIEGNVLNAATFMNVVSIALIVGEMEWAEEFMKMFIQYVPDEDREITLNLCFGQLFLEKGLISKSLNDFYDALKYFNFIPNRAGIKYDLRVRPGILRAYFEIYTIKKEGTDDVLQHARNFQRHLTNSELYTDATRDPYINFIRYFRILSRLYEHKRNRVEVIKVINKIESEKKLVHKRWLLLKAKGLLIEEQSHEL